ncbi:glycerol-3-phosphate dehydrogenase/oxidase [Lipingzhangella sp. LS1_29]|uniref:Glycerol-3-phosphate dehydrogenase/oxidase n=1 Tax=Lipingzhangella rawalii TaxID=2055835 RepID=A0ABU2H8S8_9ACTN|nr:glycerol-3-phosphate dehydrogenase/oxidase [Lipingzhangella rawalii]MDS1271701.1 glycerol-3-phosphate dehydrogenase/oxidase [Lipingzhangella rawalii]
MTTHNIEHDPTRRPYDLLVIGGGISGLSTAWQAARSGLRVAVVDRGDLGAETSSASTKLVHGGLRYLATGSAGLVWENHAERRALAERVAPHLVRPMPFLLPLYRGGPHGPAKIGAGMVTYSALSGFHDGLGRLVGPRRARQMAPELRTTGLRSCGLYHDHQMNDSRLAIMVARAARRAGALLLNHTEVTALRTTHGQVSGAELIDRLDGTEFGIDAHAVVNATGPWVDTLRRLEDPTAEPSVRLSKGAHLVMRTGHRWQSALVVPVDKVRVSFAVPWEGHLLLGTTDATYTGDPATVACTQEDADQIRSELAPALRADQLNAERIAYSFAGLRVLPGRPGQDSARAPRETVVTVGPGGMISVAGGKWTTFRRIGAQVLDQVRRRLPAVVPDRTTVPVPGVAQPQAVARLLRSGVPPLPADVAEHLATHYGALSHDVLSYVRSAPKLLDRIHPDGPDIWAQAVYGHTHEWARTVDDVLRRRTTVTVRGLETPEIRQRTAQLLASPPCGSSRDSEALTG